MWVNEGGCENSSSLLMDLLIFWEIFGVWQYWGLDRISQISVRQRFKLMRQVV